MFPLAFVCELLGILRAVLKKYTPGSNTNTCAYISGYEYSRMSARVLFYTTYFGLRRMLERMRFYARSDCACVNELEKLLRGFHPKNSNECLDWMQRQHGLTFHFCMEHTQFNRFDAKEHPDLFALLGKENKEELGRPKDIEMKYQCENGDKGKMTDPELIRAWLGNEFTVGTVEFTVHWSVGPDGLLSS